MTRAFARAALGGIATLSLLVGCKTAPPKTVVGPGADAAWADQYLQLESLNAYSLSGRVGVAANGQGFNASLRYRQSVSSSELSLDGPLGIGGVRVALEGADLEITTSRGEHLDGAAGREELERRLGFELPLHELRWWLLGVPAPGPAERVTAEGSEEIREFVQNGWRVIINSRAPGLGFALPLRLTAERDGARMKLLVEDWQP